MEWSSILGQLGGQTKQRLQALEHLQGYVDNNVTHKDQVSALLDMSGQLLSDNNHKVALKLLNCWEAIAANNGDVLRPYVGALLPPVVERLSDHKQEVRQAACNLLLALLQVQRADVMMDKLGRFWSHKHWKVRHGLLQFVAEAVATTGEAVLAPPREEGGWVLHKIIQLVGDPESAVRDAAIECLEEVYKVYGEQLVDILSGHTLRPAHLNAVYARLAQMGADVALAPSSSTGFADQSPRGSKGQQGQQGQQHRGAYSVTALAGEDYDTACSGGDVAALHGSAGGSVAGCEDEEGYAVGDEDVGQEDDGDEEEDEEEEQQAAAFRQPAHQQYAGAAARRQQQHPAADDSSCVTDASRSWGTAAAAVAAAGAGGGATRKRGGYKDGGGITSDGVLPQTQPIYLASERELRGEVERIMATLGRGTVVNWEKRVAALLRLEGIVKGGAANSFEAVFMDSLRALRDPILEQMIDRRSAVARQAAHLMQELAAELGPRCEPYGVVFMGALFKALVITVQVVSESADAAAKGILHHCRAPRLVPFVCEALARDKNAKLRQHCSTYLLQILEDWEPHEYARCLDSIEMALAAAVQDAIGETRTAGRLAFAAYSAAMPERAGGLLRRLDNGLQQKLQEAVAQYGSGGGGGGVQGGRAGATSQQAMRQPPGRPARAVEPDTASMGPPAAAKPPRSGRMGGVYQRAAVQQQQQQQPVPAAVQAPAATSSSGSFMPEPAAAASRTSRKSVAGMPMRVPGPPIADTLLTATAVASAAPAPGAYDDSAAAVAAAAGGRRRTSVMPQRVPYSSSGPDAPGLGAAALVAGTAGPVVGSKASLGAEAAKVTLPQGADEFEGHAEMTGVAGGGSRVLAAAQDYSGSRPYQQPKQASAQQQHGYRAVPSSDDLQLQNAVRDQQLQLQYQQQMQVQQQQQMQQHQLQQQQQQQQQYHYQEQLSAQPSSASVMSVSAAIAGLGGLQQPQRPASLAKAVAGVTANSKDWKERVERMNLLVETLGRLAESGGESYAELEKVLPKLMAAADDPHFKVSLAALAALQVCLNTAPHSLEASLDKLMPLLFLKLCGAKQSVRSAAEGALQACALRLDADALLPALIRSLEVMKQPAARVSVMEFAVLFLGEGKVAGLPSTATHVKQWVSRNVPLLLDKNPNVRQMAGRALGTMYSIDPASVAAYLQHASAQEVIAAQRSLADAEARSAEEQQQHSAAAAHGAGALLDPSCLPSWAAHRSTWGTGDRGANSTSSSMDMSVASAAGGGGGGGGGCGEAAAVYGLAAGVAELGIGAEAAGPGPRHAAAGFRQPAGAPAAAAVVEVQPGLSHQQHDVNHHDQQQAAAVAAAQQQQHSAAHHHHHHHHHQQQGAGVEAAGAAGHSGAAAVVAAGGVGMDVLGRPLPASYDSSDPSGRTTPAAGSSSGAAPAAAAAAPASAAAGDQPSGNGAAAAVAAAAAAGDAGSQARHLTVLVHRLQSKPGEEVLAELAACAGTMCRQAWEENFSKVLLAGLSAAQHSHEPIRELAFLLVLALARHQGDLFGPVLDVVLQPLLQGCADSSREVLMAAQQALDVLMGLMPPRRCADILAHKLPSEAAVASGTAVDGEVLCATIRCLQLVCQHMAPADMLAVAPQQLLPGLFAAFQHSRPDVRKAVVFCLVEMWHTAGDGLTPHLESLSTSQLKLLTIYYNRTQQQAGKQHEEA